MPFKVLLEVALIKMPLNLMENQQGFRCQPKVAVLQKALRDTCEEGDIHPPYNEAF